jgi:ribosomal-protein-alanine N-acetyltransferase
MREWQVALPVREGITLTEIRETDRDALVEYLNDPEMYARTLRIPSPYAPADAEKYLANVAIACARHGGVSQLAIRNAAGKQIGGCGFERISPGHQAEIGYWVARPFWGQGIATDAVRVACQFAIDTWQLVRITGLVFDFNLASARVLEKNGFQQEGVLRKHVLKEGRFLDCRLYALVR